MNFSLIVPIAADKPEYEYKLPYVFNFAEDGIVLCVKSIQGLDFKRFDKIYFVILRKLDKKYNLSELLKMQFRMLGMENASITILESQTASQVETIYQCIKNNNITGGIFIKDADGYFSCDFTFTNGIAIYPLDKMDLINPHNKSYIELDDQFYITNIIEKKIISRYFNAGGYIFDDVETFCKYYEKLKEYSPLYMSHVVYDMLLDGILFRPFEVDNFIDWGNKLLYKNLINNSL